MVNNSQNTVTLDTTIEGYLRGCVGFAVDDNAISTILIDRGLSPRTDVTELDKRTKELCKADLLSYGSKLPSVKGSTEDAHGVWKHKEGSMELSEKDKRDMRIEADGIYKRYGENTTGSTIRMTARGMRIWRK